MLGTQHPRISLGAGHRGINRWGNSGRLYFGGSRITADGDCSEVKRCVLLGRKATANLDSILTSRDIITLPTEVHPVEDMVFPVVM